MGNEKVSNPVTPEGEDVPSQPVTATWYEIRRTWGRSWDESGHVMTYTPETTGEDVKYPAGVCVHRDATVDDTVRMTIGTPHIYHPQGIFIDRGAVIGGNVALMPGAVIGGGSTVEPGACLCEKVSVGEGATVSRDCTVREGSTVGDGVVTGRGSVIGPQSVLT